MRLWGGISSGGSHPCIRPTRTISGFGGRSAGSLAGRCLQLLHHLVDGEAGSLLSRRIFLERRQELADVALCRCQQEDMIDVPVPIGVGGDGRLLVRIGAQIVKPRNPRLHEGFAPQGKGTR